MPKKTSNISGAKRDSLRRVLAVALLREKYPQEYIIISKRAAEIFPYKHRAGDNKASFTELMGEQ